MLHNKKDNQNMTDVVNWKAFNGAGQPTLEIVWSSWQRQ